MLTYPLRAILIWVKTWVKSFGAKSLQKSPNFSSHKTKEKVLKSCDSRTFYGCGGRTRTYDLRVMSPTSFQLLYSAIFSRAPQVPDYIIIRFPVCQALFLKFLNLFSHIFLHGPMPAEFCRIPLIPSRIPHARFSGRGSLHTLYHVNWEG